MASALAEPVLRLSGESGKLKSSYTMHFTRALRQSSEADQGVDMSEARCSSKGTLLSWEQLCTARHLFLVRLSICAYLGTPQLHSSAHHCQIRPEHTKIELRCAAGSATKAARQTAAPWWYLSDSSVHSSEA